MHLRHLVWGLGLLAFVGSVHSAQRTVRRQFAESEELLRNPECGWVAYNYEDGYALRKRAAEGQEPFRFASVLYTRHPAKAWEDGEGALEGSAPIRLLEDWMEHDWDVAFRIYANGLGDLPARFRDGTKTLADLGVQGRENAIAYWDESYVEEHRRLVEWLGERLAGNPHLAYVDIGGVGNTGGEWHFAPKSAYRQAGLDDDSTYELVATFVQMYREAFPDARLLIGYDCIGHSGQRRGDVIDLLKENDVGVRDDNLGGWPYPRAYPPISQWPMAGLWRRMPVAFDGGGKGGGVYGWALQEKDPERVLKWVFRHSPPTYVNLGGAESASEKACAEMPELLSKYGKKLGYRFVLLEAECRKLWAPVDTVELKMRWANRGGALCYDNKPLQVFLMDGEGQVVHTWEIQPDPPTSAWRPESERTVRAELKVPIGLRPGEYTLRLSLLLGDPRAPERTVPIATRGADEDGRLTVGTVRIAE